MFSFFPTAEKFRSLNSSKSGSVDDERLCFFFLSRFIRPAAAPEVVGEIDGPAVG